MQASGRGGIGQTLEIAAKIKRLRNNEMSTNPILRAKQVKALKAYYKDSTDRFNDWVAGGRRGQPREHLPYPEFCRGMKCEAKTRSGHPCKNDGTNWANGRCKYHGGASTGPVTPEGKKKVSQNSKRNEVFDGGNIVVPLAKQSQSNVINYYP